MRKRGKYNTKRRNAQENSPKLEKSTDQDWEKGGHGE
jgi:hypothetical protein